MPATKTLRLSCHHPGCGWSGDIDDATATPTKRHRAPYNLACPDCTAALNCQLCGSLLDPFDYKAGGGWGCSTCYPHD